MNGDFIQLLDTGMVLLGIGMGFVFEFLVIMVWTMNGMSACVRILNKFFPEEIENLDKKVKRTNVSDDEAIAVAIAVAKARG